MELIDYKLLEYLYEMEIEILMSKEKEKKSSLINDYRCDHEI